MKKNIRKTTMIVTMRVVIMKKRIVKKRIMMKPRPATHCAVPKIYANNKRGVLLLGKVTSVQFVRGVCTVFLVLMERWKLWLA